MGNIRITYPTRRNLWFYSLHYRIKKVKTGLSPHWRVEILHPVYMGWAFIGNVYFQKYGYKKPTQMFAWLEGMPFPRTDVIDSIDKDHRRWGKRGIF